MLVMMENALVKAEDDDERINVVQEIGSVMQVFITILITCQFSLKLKSLQSKRKINLMSIVTMVATIVLKKS